VTRDLPMGQLLSALPEDDWAVPRMLLREHRGAADELAFMLIRPDAVVQGLSTAIVEWLGGHGFGLVDAAVIRPHARLLEELYRYTQVRLMDAGNRPMWWFTPRYYELDSAIAVLMRRPRTEPTASALLAELKGPANPALTVPGQLRYEFRSQNMVMCVVHTSDATESTLREACLFLGERRVRSVLETASGVAVEPHRVLPNNGRRLRPNFHQAIAGLQRRILLRHHRSLDSAIAVADTLTESIGGTLEAPDYAARTEALLALWRNGHAAELAAALHRAPACELADDLVFLRWSTALRATSSAFADGVLDRLRASGHEFDRYETILLETGLGFHDWIASRFRPATDDTALVRAEFESAEFEQVGRTS